MTSFTLPRNNALLGNSSHHFTGGEYESEHFNFCPSLNSQHLDVAICCERVGIVAEKNPQSGAECRLETQWQRPGGGRVQQAWPRASGPAVWL